MFFHDNLFFVYNTHKQPKQRSCFIQADSTFGQIQTRFNICSSFVMGFIAAFMEKMTVELSHKDSENWHSDPPPLVALTIIMRSISMKVYLNLPEFSFHFGWIKHPFQGCTNQIHTLIMVDSTMKFCMGREKRHFYRWFWVSCTSKVLAFWYFKLKCFTNQSGSGMFLHFLKNKEERIFMTW